jgi:hypothetical protein
MAIRADTLDVEAFKIDSSKSKIRGESKNIRVPIRVRDRHALSLDANS